MYFARKLFTWNFEAWRRVGYFDKRKRSFVYVVSIIVPQLMVLLIASNFYTSRNDLEVIIYSFFNIIVCFTGAVRTNVILKKQQKFIEVLDDIEKWYMSFKEQNDEHALEKLNELVQKVGFFSKYCLRFVIILFFIIFLQPLITSYGSLVAEFDIPGIDIHKSPLFEFMFIWQAFWIVPITACSYVPYSSFLMIFICFGIFALRDLQRKIEGTSKMEERDAMESIKKCIVYHVKIIKYRNDLEDIFSFMSLIDVSLYCTTLCGMLIYTTMDFTYVLMIKGSLVLLLLTVLIFLTYYLADIFTQESLNIAQAAYDTNWMDRGKEYRRCVLLIMARSQRPLVLTAGDFQPMNMNTFLAIMRASYSFFSLLQSTM